MRIEHIAMYVNNLEKTKDFFICYFNAKCNKLYHNKKTNFKSYFLTFDSGARLEIMNTPDMIDTEKTQLKTGLAHIAFSVGSREDVGFLTDRLKSDGYKVVSSPRITGDGYYESCVLDPDGNQIEITV